MDDTTPNESVLLNYSLYLFACIKGATTLGITGIQDWSHISSKKMYNNRITMQKNNSVNCTHYKKAN
jgi:hypothetical protein